MTLSFLAYLFRKSLLTTCPIKNDDSTNAIMRKLFRTGKFEFLPIARFAICKERSLDTRSRSIPVRKGIVDYRLQGLGVTRSVTYKTN